MSWITYEAIGNCSNLSTKDSKSSSLSRTNGSNLPSVTIPNSRRDVRRVRCTDASLNLAETRLGLSDCFICSFWAGARGSDQQTNLQCSYVRKKGSPRFQRYAWTMTQEAQISKTWRWRTSVKQFCQCEAYWFFGNGDAARWYPVPFMQV